MIEEHEEDILESLLETRGVSRIELHFCVPSLGTMQMLLDMKLHSDASLDPTW